MGYQSYKDLEIYQLSHKLAIEIHKMTLELPKFELYEEGSQLRKSAKSICANIVEGFGRRRYKNEFIQFLTYALASCDETREHLALLFDTESLRDRERHEYFLGEYEKLGKQLTRFIQSVDRSHLTLRPVSSIQDRASRKSFTLVEVLVALAVFALVMAAAGEMYISVQQAWQRQRATVDLVQNARWAMEFMSNEIRQGGSVNNNPGGGLPRGQGVRFQDFFGNRVFYWRGDTSSDTTALGDSSYLYRGVDININQAYNVRQQLANFIVDNPDLINNTTGFPPGGDGVDPIFIENAGLVTIELTLRPNPAQPAGAGNLDYTIRTQVRPRN